MIWLLGTLVWADAPAEAPPPTTEAPETPAPAVDDLPIEVAPEIIRWVDAVYPAAALAERRAATVVLEVELDAAGQVIRADVTTPAGFGFDEAAQAAVRATAFTPARTAAGPVPVVFPFTYEFDPANAVIPDDAPRAVLEGQLRQMGTRLPIRGATVVLSDLDPPLQATTDDDGRFRIADIPPGKHHIRLLDARHVTTEQDLDLPSGQLTSAALWMRAETYRENESVLSYETEKDEVTRRTLTIEQVKRVPGSFGDPVKVIQSLPGAARSPFGTGLLIIRGSNPEDSGVYVDGIRIPIVYHLTGTTSILSPDIVKSVDYLPGGYGVQYGRTLAGTIDIQTKTEFPTRKLVWGTDVLDSQLYYEGPLDKAGRHQIAVGARRSYIDAFIPLFTQNTGFTVKPVYWDYQLKYATRFDEDKQLSVFVYGFQDVLDIQTPADRANGTDQDTQGGFQTEYLSHRLLATWRHQISDTLRYQITPSVGFDRTSLGVADSFGVDAETFVLQLRSQFEWEPHPAIGVSAGTDIAGGTWGIDFKSPFRFVDLGDPLAERQAVGFSGRGTAFGPDLWFKANIRPLADRDRLVITPGIRSNIYLVSQKSGLDGEGEVLPPLQIRSGDPRLSARFELVKGAWLKGSTGWYHQPPQPQESIGAGSAANVYFEQAFNSSIGFEHQVSPLFQWDVDLFWRDMRRLIEFKDGWLGFGDSPFENRGKGRAYGAELIARVNPVGNFFGWVSYTLSRSERKESADGDWVPFDYDQTHILVANAAYDLPLDIGVSAQFQYVTGNPTTQFNAGVYDVDGNFYNGFRVGDANGDRLPPYLQTSLRVDKLWTFRKWQLLTYLEAINAIRGINPEFTNYNYDYSEFAYVRGLPFIPNIGIEARFAP